MVFKEGSEVERVLDDVWFPARVISCTFGKLFDIEFLDDGKVERDVPLEDLRASSTPESTAAGGAAKEKEEPLSGPLKELFPHDEVKVVECTPKVTRYGVNDDTRATALILGPQEDVAHGGGLRALRILKKRPQT